MSNASVPMPEPLSSQSLPRQTEWSEFVILILTRICLIASGCVFLLVVLFLANESWPALSKVGIIRFFSDPSWHPLSGQFNLRPMLVATLLTSLGAIVLATPLAVATAIYQTFYLPRRLAWLLERLLEVMTGIPSVCFGLWGLTVLSPYIGSLSGTSGQNLLTAILTLTLMILPTVTISSLIALRAVPQDWLNAGAALGLSRANISLKIALPAAVRGIGVGIILGVCRAIGETMAVVMVAGNVPNFPSSPLDPVRTTTATIALEMGYATAEHRSLLYATALILVLMILAWLVAGLLLRLRFHD